MATERSSAGDPSRTLALLWREASTPAGTARGPRPTLSVDRVVSVGLAIADAEGLDAVTMRRVATELAVAPMTLYTYVPGKAELLDLIAKQHAPVFEHALAQDFCLSALGAQELADDAAHAAGPPPQALARLILEQPEEAIARESRGREHQRAEQRVVVHARADQGDSSSSLAW